MNLWNIIRDWFVIYIWGGYTSNEIGYTNNVIGFAQTFTAEGIDEGNMTAGTEYIRFVVGKGGEYFYDLSLADWLSTTSTIIVLCLMCAFLIMCVIWLFKFFGGLFKW